MTPPCSTSCGPLASPRSSANLDRTAFLTDLKTQAAVLHELLVLGEAAKRLSVEFREDRPILLGRGLPAASPQAVRRW